METGKDQERVWRINENSLTQEQIIQLKQLANGTIDKLKSEHPWALNRCTFFASTGFSTFQKVLASTPLFTNERIEGKDDNPFDQHYWLGCDVCTTESETDAIIIDPIFNYFGLERLAKEILGDAFLEYYKKKRIVLPNKPYWEGGVRVKTIGI